MKTDTTLTSGCHHQLHPGIAYGISDVGLVRPDNEDNFLINETMCLLMVADGMGGHEAGEIASAGALTAIREHLQGALEAEADADVTLPGHLARKALTAAHDPDATWTDETTPAVGAVFDAIEFANQKLYAKNVDREMADGGGMGTTLTGLWRPSASSPAIVFQVGDSRLYRYRAGELTQLTRDQSLYQQAIDAGMIDNLPKRSILLQAIGPAMHIKPDVKTYAIEAGDLFLLCSDGLHGSVAHAGIHDVLSTAAADGLESACRRLIALAKADGGPDNITVVLASLDTD